MYISHILAVVSTTLGVVTAVPAHSPVQNRSPVPRLVDGRYHLQDRATSFKHHATFTFEDGQLPDGLESSVERVGDRTYTEDNIQFKNGYLVLMVPGGQTRKPYTGGEIVTSVGNIKYGSVRTTAILPSSPGVCSAAFFYRSDTQESDIEWLSDPNSESNQGTAKIWYTNQDANGDGEDTHGAVAPPRDATTTEHEYRLDWTKGRTEWFVNGKSVFVATKDVPSKPGPWMWNNWSDGGKGWTAGPPKKDAPFKIKKIEMYYNTA